jgi:hypothetical protein
MRGELLGTIYYYSLYKIKFKAIPIYYITFVPLFNNSNRLGNNKDNYNSNFENTPNLNKLKELLFNKEIIFLNNNNNSFNNNKLKKEPYLLILKQFFIKLLLIKLLKLPFIKIFKILFNYLYLN